MNSFNSVKCSVQHNPANVLLANNARYLSSAFVAGEPAGPEVKTAIPGPRSLAMLAEMKTIQVSYNKTCNMRSFILKIPI